MTKVRQTGIFLACRPWLIRALLLWALFCSLPARAQPPGRASPVSVATIEEREVAAGQAFLGTVYPHRKATVGSSEADRVIKFAVNEGDLVEAGQVLAELRSETLRIELAQAEAEAELRRQELEELKNGTRQEDKDAAAAELARDQALLEYAESRYQRAQQLIRQNQAISQEELDEAKSAAVAARNNQLASKAKYDLALKGPREEQILQAQARYDAQQQAVKRIEDLIDQRTIRAPFAGYVTAEHTEEGQWLMRGDPVVDLVDLETVEVHASVPEQYISFVKKGMKAPVRVVAIPGDVFEGEVVRVVPQADVRSRTFPVIVRVANQREGDVFAFKAGMLARVTLAVGEPQRAKLVPKDALVLGGETPRVFVVRRDPDDKTKGTAEMVPVEIGVADGGLIQITGAVVKGQLVVTKGNERLLPFGQPVQIVE